VLVLSDAEARTLVSAAAAVEVAERMLVRPDLESGAVSELSLKRGRLSVAPAADREAGNAGVDTLASFPLAGTLAVTLVLADDRPVLLATVESARLAHCAAAATSAVAARRLACPGAGSIGVIGCGPHAAAQVECLRLALPGLQRVVAYSRSTERVDAFCREHGAEPAGYGREAAEQDVVVTATSSRDPVLRGDWLRPGALVCAAGTTDLGARELDNVVLERAAFVCCDSPAAARRRAGDLVEPVDRGVLDWLEVHGLTEVIGDSAEGRQAADDIVVVKIVGLPELRLALARLAVARATAR
jgi:alanine dehydrogenase